MPVLPVLSVHTMTGSALSLLLVFRTNTAYQRFQEGRRMWNDILDLSRDIALNTALYRNEIGSKWVPVVRKLLQAFPFAMQEHVHAKNISSSRLELLLDE